MPTLDKNEDIIIVRAAGEVSLKGNQALDHFIKMLTRNIKAALNQYQIPFKIEYRLKRLFITTSQKDDVLAILPRIFGIGSFSAVDKILNTTDIDTIIDAGVELYQDKIAGKTFCVRAKRFGGSPMSSSTVNMRLGGALNQAVESAKVKLTKPDITIRVEILGQEVYLHASRIIGAGGLPINKKNRSLCLISGGFDSAVAAWQIMRRGVAIDYVFCNLGGSAYERLVIQVVKTLADLWSYGYEPNMYIIDFDEIVTELQQKTSNTYRQVALKRLMYRAANGIGKMLRYEAIITGEAIGQVSSQTIKNLSIIEAASDFIILRPLVGMDKSEIVHKAQYIGTATLSEKIKEYCGISKGQPVISGNYEKLNEEENNLDLEILHKAVSRRKKIKLSDVTDKDLRSDYLFKETLPEDSLIIDCQTEEFYKQWHAPDAKNIPADQFMSEYRQLDKDKSYLLYCNWGTQSPYLAEIMQQEGYDAYAFKGGLAKFKSLLAQKSAS